MGDGRQYPWRAGGGMAGGVSGIDLREGLKSSSQLEQARHVLREHVTHYDDDRFFAPDIDKAMQLLEEGRLVGLLPSVL